MPHQELGPPGKTYDVICFKCREPRWPYLTRPPAPDWTCLRCVQNEFYKPKKRRGPRKEKPQRAVKGKVRVRKAKVTASKDSN